MDREQYIKEVFGERTEKHPPVKMEEIQADDVQKHRRFVSVLRNLGGEARKSQVINRGPLLACEVEAIAALLSAEGLIVVQYNESTGGRPATIYRLVQQ